jgi:hypothetical protein
LFSNAASAATTSPAPPEVSISFNCYRSDARGAGGERIFSRPDEPYEKLLVERTGTAEDYTFLPGESVTITAHVAGGGGGTLAIRLTGLLHGVKKEGKPVDVAEAGGAGGKAVLTFDVPKDVPDFEVYRTEALLNGKSVASKAFYAARPGRGQIEGDTLAPRLTVTMYSGYVNTFDAGSIMGFRAGGLPTTDDYSTFWGWRVQGNEDLQPTAETKEAKDNVPAHPERLPNRPGDDWNWYWSYYANQQLGFSGDFGNWQWGEYNPFLHENLPHRGAYPNAIFGYYSPDWYAAGNCLLHHYGTLPNGLYIREWMNPIWRQWAAAAHAKDPAANVNVSGIDFWGEELGPSAPQPSHIAGFLAHLQKTEGATVEARTARELYAKIQKEHTDSFAVWSQSNLTLASQIYTKAAVEKQLEGRKAIWWNQNTGPSIWFYTGGLWGGKYSSPPDLEDWGKEWAKLIDYVSTDGSMVGGMPKGREYRCWSVYETFWKACIPQSNRAWMWNTAGSYGGQPGIELVNQEINSNARMRRYFLQPAFTAVYDAEGKIIPVLNVSVGHVGGTGWEFLMTYWDIRKAGGPADRVTDVEICRRAWELAEVMKPIDPLGPVLIVSSRRTADTTAGTEFDTRKLGEFVSGLRDQGIGISTFADAAWASPTKLPHGTPAITAPRFDGKGNLMVSLTAADGTTETLAYPKDAGGWRELAAAVRKIDDSLVFDGGAGGVTGYGIITQAGPLVFVENPTDHAITGKIRIRLPARTGEPAKRRTGESPSPVAVSPLAGSKEGAAVELLSGTTLESAVADGVITISIAMEAEDGRLVLVSTTTPPVP